MKVLQINSVVNKGSTGRICEQIATTLLTNEVGAECTIAYGRDSNRSSHHIIRIGDKCSVLHHVLETRLFDRHGLSSKRATMMFLNEIADQKYDLIHIHNIHGYYINYKLLFDFIKNRNIPVIWTLHDCWPFTGHCSHFDYADCEKWKSECNHCPQLRRYPKTWYDRSKLNFQTKKSSFTGVNQMTLVPVSNWLSKFLQSSFLSEYPVRVVHNGIDLSSFLRSPNVVTLKKKLGFEDEDNILLGVANIWEERKGLYYFEQLATRLPVSFKIVLIGLSKKQMRDLPPNIVGKQRTESVRELADYYSIADAFVNPTLEDNYPTTNMEAMACGTPVITFDTGGSPESIDKDTGIVVSRGDINKLSDACIYIVDAKKRGLYSVEVCRNKAEREFDQNKKFIEYIKLYNDVLKKL